MNGALDLHPKVAATGITGAAGLLVLWLLSLAHVNVTPEVAGALVLVLGAAGGYLAPILNREKAAATTATK